jgi:hypothetical protein
VSEASHRRTNTIPFHLHVASLIETGSSMAVTRDWREGKREVLFNKYRISDWQDRKV